MRAPPRRATSAAFALSALAHALLLAPLAPALWRPRAPAAPADPWLGGGVGGDEVSVELGADAPPAAPPSPAPAAPTPLAPPSPAPAAPARPGAAARAEGGADPALEPDGEGEARRVTGPRTPSRRASAPATTARAATTGAASRAGAASSLGAGEAGTSRGVGSEAAASPRDLGRAFTRAIGPGSQADAAWAALPAGWAGALDVVLEVDATGSLAGFELLGERPSAPLRELVRRTVALLRGGVFAPRGGAPGAGKVRLKLRARTRDVDPSAVEGGRIDLEFSFENGKGRASFTQVGGRRVDVDVEAPRARAPG